MGWRGAAGRSGSVGRVGSSGGGGGSEPAIAAHATRIGGRAGAFSAHRRPAPPRGPFAWASSLWHSSCGARRAMEGQAQPLGGGLAAAPARPLGTALESRRVRVWALTALTALAFVLRLTSLSRSLFNDETFSFALAQRGFGHMISLAGYEANGMPYSVILWPVTRLFGTSVEVLRAPAVLIGTASVPLIYWAARAFSRDRLVALLAAALLAINPMAIWYSQVARSYALVVFGVCVAFGALGRALEAGERRRMWWLYAGGMALTAYSDLVAPAIVLPAQAVMVWSAGDSERRQELLRRWLASLAAI